MKSVKLTSIIISLGIVVLLSGCLKDEIVLTDPQNFNRPLNLAAPVFNAHFSAKDLLDKIGSDSIDMIFTDSEGLLHAKIDTTFSKSYDDIIEFDEIMFINFYTIPLLKKSTKAQIPFLFRDTIPASVKDDQRFDSLTMKTAQIMDIVVTAPPGFTGEYTITFPEIILPNGTVLVMKGDIGGDPSGTTDLTGSTFHFFQDTKNNKSSFEMVIEGYTELSGVPGGTQLEVSTVIKDFRPDIVWGYFGEVNIIDISEEMDFDFFTDFNFTDMIQFKSVDLKLKAENYFGIPISVLIDSMVFKDTVKGIEVDIDKTALHVNAATLASPPISATDSITIPIAEAINIAPNKMVFKILGAINYDGNPATDKNFLINDGEADLNATLEVLVPFWFQTKNYERTDTISFNVREIADSTSIDYLDELNLYFDFDNGFPFNIYAQAYFADSLGNLVDSLFEGDQLIWKSPTIGTDGKAIGVENTQVNIQLLHDQVKDLYDNYASQIFIVSHVQTGGLAGSPDTPEFVKLFDSYTIDMSMSFEVKSNEIKY